MLVDGLTLIEGSTATNLVIASGSNFPSSANIGELFYRSDLSQLSIYNGSTWTNVSSVGGLGTVTSLGISSSDLEVSGSPVTSSGTITLSLNTVPISKGGTGATTTATAINNLLPAQTANSQKFLKTDGTNVSWAAVTTATVYVGTSTGDIAAAEGAIFYADGTGDSAEGLHVYSGGNWIQVTGAGSIPSGLFTADIEGDVSGTIVGGDTSTLTLSNSGVSAGTYTKVTVDAKGRVTTATTLSAGDIPSLSSTYQPLDADLTAISGLAGNSGLLKKTAADTWSLDTNTYLTGNQSITVSGDATGSGSTSIPLTLANSGVAAGTYTKVTVDAKGRVTTATTLSAGDIPSLAGTYLTGNQPIAISGDATGSGSTSISLTLANSGVSAGTFTKVTVDAKGRVTTATTLSISDIPSLTSLYQSSDSDLTAIAALSGNNGFLKKTAGTWNLDTASYQPLDADLTAIGGLAGTSGALKKTAANTWELDTSTYLTGNQTITVSGDATGSGSTSISLTLANSGATAGTYGSASVVPAVTVDAKGRVTGVTTSSIAIAASQITSGTLSDDRVAASNVTQHQSSLTIAESQITDGAILARIDSSETISGTWTFNSPVTVGTPVSSNHAATKDYVDNAITGLDMKASVRVATTANISLAGTQTIDGVAVVSGNRVLVKDQATASENGIYVVAAGAWGRASDADNTPDGEVTSGMYTFVEEGTVNADSGWVLSTNNPISLGSTGLTFVQFNGLGQVTAGSGLTKTGNTMNVISASADRVVVNADSIDLATTGTAGTYAKVTTDAYGRVVSGTTLSAGDIPNLSSTYQPLDADLTAIGALAGTSGLLKKTAADTWSLDTNTYLTGNQSISVSGDATGSGSTSISLTLANSGVAAGTFTKVTVDAKGRVTTATTLVAGDIPALSQYVLKAGDTMTGTLTGTNFYAGAGSESSPSMSFSADNNTGIYNPTADTIAFVEGGTEVMRIDSAGNVGIGTSTYSSKLTVHGGDITLSSNARYVRSVTTAGTAVRMLGINAFDVAYVGPIDSGPVSTIFNAAATSLAATFYTTGTEKMRIDSAGNVGIGITTPQGRLDVSGATSDVWPSGPGGLIINGCAINTSTSTIVTYLDNSSITIGAGVSQKTGILITGQSSGAGSTVQFRTGNAERMRLTTAGNLGIGTASPEVIANYVNVESSGTTGGIFQATNGTQKVAMYVNATNGYAGTRSNHPFLLVVNAAERMRIDTGGNVGIGATPSSGISGIPVLQINSAQFGSLGGPNGHFFITANGYPATSTDEGFATWNYMRSEARATKFDSRDGNFRWYSTPTVGTAGSTITFTNIMSLQYDGQLLHSTGTAAAPSITFLGDTNTGIYSPAADTIGFTKGGAEAMRIDSAGNLSVGTTSNPLSQRVLIEGTSAGGVGGLGSSYLLSVKAASTSSYLGLNHTAISTIGAESLIFGTNNAERMRISSTGDVGIGTTSAATFLTEFSAGSKGLAIMAAVPTIALVDDEDTTNDRSWIANTAGDMYISNKNTSGRIIIQNAGAERMRIDASGRVLIGTGAAAGQLPAGSVQIASGAHFASDTFGRIFVPGQAIGSASYAGLYGLASTYLAYYSAGWKSLGGGTASAITIDEGIFSFCNSNSVAAPGSTLTWTTRLMIDQSGNLVVGSASALTGGKISGISDLSTTNGFVYRDSASTYANNNNYILLQNSSSNTVGALTHPAVQSLGVWGWDDIRFLTGSGPTERMRINSTGNVGIGTTSINSKFEVMSSVGEIARFSTPTSQRLHVYANSSTNAGSGIQAQNSDLRLSVFDPSTNIRFFTGDGTVETERMRLDFNGNLGLGVTPNTGTSSGLYLKNNANISYGGPTSYYDSNAAFSAGADRYVTTAAATRYQHTSGEHRWLNAPSGTAGSAISFTQAMTLDASGNLGLGVTPSAWALTGSKVVSVGSTGATFVGQTSQPEIWQNAYHDGTSVRYVTAGAASRFSLGSDAVFRWFQTSSGSAGSATTFTQVMTLDTGGNLGVGTASPTQRLHVVNTQNSTTACLIANSSTGTAAQAITQYTNGSHTHNFGILGTGYTTYGVLSASNAFIYSGGTNDISLAADGVAAIKFGTGAGVPERMRITATGNVGIGTSSPTSLLTANLSTAATSTSGISVQIQRTTSGTAAAGLAGALQYTLQDAGGNLINVNAIRSEWVNPAIGTRTAKMVFTSASGNAQTDAMTLDSSGNLGVGVASPVNKVDISGSLGRGAPVTKAADFSVGAAENWLIVNKSGSTCTVTLPTASSWTGREIMIKTVQAQPVVSNASNVVPLAGGAAGTAILTGTPGKWATLVSDGSNWIIMAGA